MTVHRGRRSRIALVLAYLTVGILWIAFSDAIMATVVPPALQQAVGTTKGVIYVVVTAALAWLLLLARDTRLEREHAALEQSEQRHRMLAERSQDVVYRLSLGTEPRFEYVSPAILGITGYTPEEHYANPQLARSVIHPDDRAALERASRLGSDEPVLIRCIRRDGETIWVEHRLTTVRDAGGRPIAVEGAARDVTVRIHADEHRRLLSEAIDATPVGVVVATGPAEGYRLTYVNEAMARLVSTPVAALVGRSGRDYLEAPDRGAAARLGAAMAVGAPVELQRQVPVPGHEPTPISILISPVKGASGEVESVIAFVTDRSEGVALSRAEAHLDRVLDASPAAIVVTDATGLVTAWNPAAERIFGRSAAETLGHPLDIVPGDERPRFEALQRRLAAGERSTPQAFELTHGDGRRVPCRVQVGLIGADPARPTGRVTVIEDLTDERARERSKVELTSAIDAAGEAILITDLHGTITYVNPACERVTGYSREELIGQNPRILKSGLTSPATYADLWRRLTGGQAWRGVLVNRRKDGTLYEEEAVFSPVAGPDGAPVAYVAVKRDLTLEHHLAAGLSSELNDRAAVQEAIATVDLGETPEETATLLCDCLLAFPGVDSVLVVHFPAAGGSAMVLGQVGVLDDDLRVGRTVDPVVGEFLRERSEAGPWSDDRGSGHADPRVAGPEFVGMAFVGAPIRHRGQLVGAVIASTSTGSPDTWTSRYVRVVCELAAHVGPLLGPALGRRDRTTTRDLPAA
jgi:PAS domain S-box-containing protein